MDELEKLRAEIDELDGKLVGIFARRMELSAEISRLKNTLELPVYMPEREKQVTARVRVAAGEELAKYAQRLYERIFELSREYQRARGGR